MASRRLVFLPSQTQRRDKPNWNALAAAFGQAIWVHLDRRSIVRQAISGAITGQTGFNHALRGEGRISPDKSTTFYRGKYTSNILIEDRALDKLCLNIVRERESWERFFSENKIEPVRLIYEDILSDATYLHEILQRLGIEREAINSDRKLMKIGNAANEKIWREYLRDK